MSKTPKNQQEQALDTLIAVQSLMGQLGFTMTSDGGYYKDYGVGDDSYARLTPIFDKGISLDMSYKLVGFNLSVNKQVHIVEGLPAPLEEFPIECVDDVKNVVANLAPGSRTQMVESFMVTATCSMCGNDVASYLHNKDGYTCLKCMGMSDEQQPEPLE